MIMKVIKKPTMFSRVTCNQSRQVLGSLFVFGTLYFYKKNKEDISGTPDFGWDSLKC